MTVELTGAAWWLFGLVTAATLLGGTAAIWVMSVVRLLRAPPPLRQQLAWLLCAVVPLFIIGLATRWQGFSIGIPVAVAVGVLRYRLLDIEITLRRGLVYAVLTGAVVAVYLVTTELVGSRLRNGPVPGVVAAGLVAVGLSPVRERVQRGVDRLLCRDRRDPMRAVTRISDTVAAAGEPGDLLPSVLSSVADASRAPGAAVLFPDGQPMAVVGVQAAGPSCPLRVGGQDVGARRVTDRSPGERYGERDSALAAGDGRTAAALLGRVRAEAATAVLEVRQILDDLRPARLDDAGLAVALRRHVAVASGGVIVELVLPAALPPLGSRIEIAALRIAQEALPNVVRHSCAGKARLALATPDGSLRIEVSDDGIGFAVSGLVVDGSPQGVGLSSMRHRAEALGGRLEVSTGTTGTVLVATLPLQVSP